MFKVFKNSLMSAVNFIDFLNHVLIGQWDVENQRQTDLPEAQLQRQE